MSKRRNLKKEKAERNKVYARKFRRRDSNSFSKNRRFSHNYKKREEDQTDSTAQE